MQRPDNEIIRGFLKGNNNDYATIAGWVKEVVSHVLFADNDTKEDVVSDTVCELLKGLQEGKFRHTSSLKTYAQTIARYKSIDAIRSRKRAQKYMQLLGNESSTSEDPPDVFRDEDEFYLLDRILNLIDPQCVRIWKMIHLEQLAYKEIAARTGLTEGAVKTRVSRCKEKALAIRGTIE